MIDGQKFFNQPVRNNLIAYDNIRKILTGQGDAYTIGLSKVFEYDHMLLNCVLSIHQKRFFDQSKHYNLLFLEWKYNIVCHFYLCPTSSDSKTKSLFTP